MWLPLRSKELTQFQFATSPHRNQCGELLQLGVHLILLGGFDDAEIEISQLDRFAPREGRKKPP